MISMCLSVCLSARLCSMCLFLCVLSVRPSFVAICLSVRVLSLSVCLSVRVLPYLFVCPCSVHIRLSVCPCSAHIRLSVFCPYLSVSMSVCPSVRLSFYLPWVKMGIRGPGELKTAGIDIETTNESYIVLANPPHSGPRTLNH